jgi:hypothetical protein
MPQPSTDIEVDPQRRHFGVRESDFALQRLVEYRWLLFLQEQIKEDIIIYRPAGRPRRTSLPLECHRNATNRTRSVSSVLHATSRVEQSRTRGGPGGGVEDQPRCAGLWHSRSPSARSLSRSPSSPPPSFTQSPSPPRSLVRDGQTSPHRPRLVVSRSTCPPLSPSPHANSFLIGTAVINTHTT